MPERINLWRTTPVRLALVFSLIFAAGVLALFGSVYWSALAYLQRQGDEIVLGQAAVLAAVPADQLADRIGSALRSDRRGVTHYALFTADGRAVAGNVARLPANLSVDGSPGGIADPAWQPGARALVRRLPDGRLLFVGYDAKTLSGLRAILLQALLWSGGGTLLAGLAVGTLFGLGPIWRLRAIGDAAARVRAGELSARLPRSRRGDELDALVDLVNAMMAEVERLLDEVKSVGDNLAHDLRTPLTHLRGHLQGALDQAGVGGSPAGIRLGAALAAADTLLGRFQAIQRIAEIDARKRRAGIAPFDLSALVLEFAELYDAVAEERGIAIVPEVAPGITLLGDRDLVAEALANLLDNALKFTRAGGTVRLVVGAPGGCPLLEVRDNGPGILPADRALVLERFGRSARDRAVPGAGLGLAMVAAVARLHDMVLELDDARPGLIVRLRASG